MFGHMKTNVNRFGRMYAIPPEDYLEQLDKADGEGVVAEKNTSKHFMGAVVVQQVSTAAKDVERRKIIDGQQRVTTVQLLQDAIQYVCKEYSTKGVTPRLLNLVTNDEELVENKEVRCKISVDNQ